MRRWQRQRREATRRKRTDATRYNPVPRRRDHIAKAWAGFGTTALTVTGAALGASANELVGKGASFAVVSAGFGALVGGLSGEALNRSRSGISSYRQARKEYREGPSAAAAVGATIADIKADLRLAREKAQRGIADYSSALSLVVEAKAELNRVMHGSSLPDADYALRQLGEAAVTLDAAIGVVKEGRDGYGELAQKL